MNEILHANIFFIIASVATVFFLVLVSIILFHIIKIVKLVRSILGRIEAGSEILARDMANLRGLVMGGSIISRFFSLFSSDDRPKKTTRSKRKIPTRAAKPRASNSKNK